MNEEVSNFRAKLVGIILQKAALLSLANVACFRCATVRQILCSRPVICYYII